MVPHPVQPLCAEPCSGTAALQATVGQSPPRLRYFGASRQSGIVRTDAAPQHRERGESLCCYRQGYAERAVAELYGIRTLPTPFSRGRGHQFATPSIRLHERATLIRARVEVDRRMLDPSG